MPTITTTVTSACASGVVTTQTTTQATPEAPAKSKGVDPRGDFVHSGQVAMLLEVSSETPAGIALLNKMNTAITASMKKHGGYNKWIETSPTSMLGLYLLPTAEALIACELDYSANPDVIEQVNDKSITMEIYFVGNVTAAAKSHFDGKWGTVDGYTMVYPEDASGGLRTPGPEAETADLFAYCGSFELQTAELMQSYWEEIRDIGSLKAHDHFLEQQVYVPTSGTRVAFFCLCTKDNYLGLLDYITANGLIASSFADADINIWTHNTSPEIKAAFVPWTANPKLNLTIDAGGSGYNDTGICGVHAKAFYRSEEDAVAAATKFGEMLAEGQRTDTCMSGSVAKYGGCGMTFFVLFKNEQAWESLDSFAAGQPGFVETCIEPALHFTGVPFGHMSSNWRAILNRWQDMWNIHWITAQTIDCTQGRAYAASAQSICGWQEFHYESPETMAASIAVTRTQEVQAAYRDHGVFWSSQKTGASSLLVCFAFPNFASWVGFSDQLSGLDESVVATMLNCPKISCYLFGDGGDSAGAKAIIDKWNALPQYDIRQLTLIGGFP